MLSESVGKAVMMTGGTEATETAKFVHMMDKFFDCMNVTSLEASKMRRKPFQQPYRSGSDFRLKVHVCCTQVQCLIIKEKSVI